MLANVEVCDCLSEGSKTPLAIWEKAIPSGWRRRLLIFENVVFHKNILQVLIGPGLGDTVPEPMHPSIIKNSGAWPWNVQAVCDVLATPIMLL